MLTTLELILKRSNYDCEHESFVEHFNDDRLVFHTILQDVSTKFSYCGMMALRDFSTAFSVPIQSYYAPTIGTYFFSELLAMIVRGRGESERKVPALILMLSHHQLPEPNNLTKEKRRR